MFQSLPEAFRKHDLSADVRTLLLIRKSMERGLINTLGDMYVVLKSIVTTDQKEFGPYALAFYDYFLNIDIKKGEKLDNAIARSETFEEWKKDYLREWNLKEDMDQQDLIDQFLNEVHMTTLDIQNLLNGDDILNNDDPNRPDGGGQAPTDGNREVREGADYSDIPLDEIRRRMREIAKQQKERHEGGDHWIGQNGRSPYGNNGAAKGGVRAGGSGGGKMARQVLNDRNYFPVDTKAVLRDDNIDAALAALKGIQDESAQRILDIPFTIKEGLRQGGIFLPHERDKIEEKMQVLLMIDNGGYSMHPYIRSVKKLFSKMKTRFAHDLKTYYFHNTIYGGAYSNAARTKFESVDKICKLDPNYTVFIIGDADMAPYELDEHSLNNWLQLKEHFKRIVWMNPTNQRIWTVSTTIVWLRQVFEMQPLTPEGIEKAVQYMNRKRRAGRL